MTETMIGTGTAPLHIMWPSIMTATRTAAQQNAVKLSAKLPNIGRQNVMKLRGGKLNVIALPSRIVTITYARQQPERTRQPQTWLSTKTLKRAQVATGAS